MPHYEDSMQQVHTSEDHNTEPSEIIKLEKEGFEEVIDECIITDCDDPFWFCV